MSIITVVIDLAKNIFTVHGVNEAGNPHIVVMFGYRQVCAKGQCTDYLRVLNSWGKGWQAANSDGWVDAQNFYEYLDFGGVSVEWITGKLFSNGIPR